MPQTVEVRIERSSEHYTIEVAENNLLKLPALMRARLSLREPLPRVLIVTHLNLNNLYGQTLQDALEKAGFTVATECFNVGESIKSWNSAERLLQKMIEYGLSRDSIVIALGGGVIGDLAGFASSIFYRGISIVQVPTSLLAMVDSSVGGKVAVNLGLSGKNLVGAFHHPCLVNIDLTLLRSLPEKEWKNGLSEVIKYALIREDDGAFYKWLMENRVPILSKSDFNIIKHMVTECIKVKAKIVMQDEKELSGTRQILNLGHTFGHSLEAASLYRLAHGEAIAIGMTLAARLSFKLGKIDDSIYDKILNIVKTFGLTDHISKSHGLTPGMLIRHFKYDKKAEGGTVKFILPVGSLSHCEIVSGVSEDLLKAVFEEATF
ncbi:MAG: 3-dehydroquinate synthase [Candidatus Caenarcaniphilales bacterium]|nr:3-dehydroquinate synthase [Candidatus Caenarcaniphilales bacterium]